MRYGFFVPVYNSSGQIEACVRSIAKAAHNLRLDSTIHIVDDTSSDSTPLVAKALARQKIQGIPLYYQRFENGPSRRENLALAMSGSDEDYLIFIDVDLATDMNYLGRLCSLLEEGFDIAIGSRYLKESRLTRSFGRLIISRCYNSAIRLFFRTRISDHQCGFKGFSRKAFVRLYNILGYDLSLRRGWFIDAEMLIIASHLKMKIAEFGIRWTEGKKSTFSIKRELRMLPYVFFELPPKLKRIDRIAKTQKTAKASHQG